MAEFVDFRRATVSKDPKSANLWVFAPALDAYARLIKEDSIIRQLTIRKVVIVPGGRESGEVSRLRDFVANNLLADFTGE